MKYILTLALILAGLAITLGAAAPSMAGSAAAAVPANDAGHLPLGTEVVQDEAGSTNFLPVIMVPAAPDPFTLISPKDGAQLDTLLPNIHFEPNDLPDDTGGCFALAAQPDPTECTWGFVSLNLDFDFVFWYKLAPDTTYYWRVGAVYDNDFDHPDWGSQQWSFITGPAGGPMPAAPLLIAPADGSMVNTDALTLQWQAVDDAAEYKVKVIDDTNGGGWSISEIFPPDTQVGPDELRVIFNRYKGPDFKWTVAVRNDYAWSEYAPYWYFTIEE